MTYTNVQVRAGPLPEYLVQSLAEFGHTIQEILEMIASCILCERDAKFTVVGLDPNWFGSTTRGKLKTLLCGLCELCVALPDVLPNVEAVARQDSITYVGQGASSFLVCWFCLKTYVDADRMRHFSVRMLRTTFNSRILV